MILKEAIIKALDNSKLSLVLKFNEDTRAINKLQKAVEENKSHFIARFMTTTTLVTLFYFAVEVSIAHLIYQNPSLLLNFRLGFWELGGALTLRYLYKKSISVYKSIY